MRNIDTETEETRLWILRLDKRISEHPNSAELYRERGDAHADLGDMEKALADYLDAARIDPANGEAHFLCGNVLAEMDEHERAIECYTASINADPNPAALANRGNSYLALDEPKKAVEDYSASIKAYIEDDDMTLEVITIFLARGEAYSMLNMHMEAIADYSEALIRDEHERGNRESILDTEYVLAQRGNMYEDVGWYADAEKDFAKAVSICQDKSTELYRMALTKSLYSRGRIHADNGEYEKAIEYYGQAIGAGFECGDPYCFRAEAYLATGRDEAALDDCNSALRIYPGAFFANRLRGNIYLNAERYADAVADFSVVLEHSPAHTEAYVLRGSAYMMMDRSDEAIRDLTRALTIDFECADAYELRGALYSSQEQYDKALEDASRLIELKPDYSDAYSMRGDVYTNIDGMENEAIADYTKAIKLDPKNAEAYFMRGMVYAEQGKKLRATKDFTKAFMLDPSLEKRANQTFDGISEQV
jgi:tetratricopeptide (TPR) repeat protein